MHTLIETPRLTVSRHSRGLLPDIPYERIKDLVLGKRYELSVSFIDTRRSCELHALYKNDPTPANILSFPFDESSGEILMHLATIRSQAPKYGHSYLDHMTYLFVHGCLHLKGFDHGDEMESEEARYLAKLGIHLPVHSNTYKK